MREKVGPFGGPGAGREGSGPDVLDGGKGRRQGRLFAVFQAVVLLALMAATAYGLLNDGLYQDEQWLPVAAGVLALLFLTLFVRGFYRGLPPAGVLLVALLGALVAVKGASMAWTVSETETVEELLRSSTYLAAFLLALAALASPRQVGPLVDVALLSVAAVAGFGLLQKISPDRYPISSVDGVTIDSTLGYSNTVAVVVGMGIVLALARLTATRTAPRGDASRVALLRAVVLRGLYAALVLAFLVALYLTVSRGGIGALGFGLVALFVLADDRLQLLGNLLLASAPGAWLYWQIRDLRALLPEGPGASEAQQISDGTAFRDGLVVALAAAFVLQALYTALAARFELAPGARRALGVAAATGVVLVMGAGVFVVASELGGPGQADQAGRADRAGGSGRSEDRAGGETGQSLASLSIGYREDYWRVGWEAWTERPLTGTGAGTFHYTWLEERPGVQGVRQVHNLYLEQGTETGVFAFAALVLFAAALVVHVARAAWRALGERRLLLAGLAAAISVYLSSSAIEWHWYIPGSTLLFFVLAGLAAKHASMKTPETAQGAPGAQGAQEAQAARTAEGSADPSGAGAP